MIVVTRTCSIDIYSVMHTLNAVVEFAKIITSAVIILKGDVVYRGRPRCNVAVRGPDGCWLSSCARTKE